jgi:hypothetical protein
MLVRNLKNKIRTLNDRLARGENSMFAVRFASAT